MCLDVIYTTIFLQACCPRKWRESYPRWCFGMCVTVSYIPSHRLLRLLRPFFTNVLATKLVWERLLLLLSNTAILTSSERHLLTRYMVAPAATSLLVRTEQERAFQPLLKCSHSLLRSITRILQWTAARWAGSVILFLIITVCYIGQWY